MYSFKKQVRTVAKFVPAVRHAPHRPPASLVESDISSSGDDDSDDGIDDFYHFDDDFEVGSDEHVRRNERNAKCIGQSENELQDSSPSAYDEFLADLPPGLVKHFGREKLIGVLSRILVSEGGEFVRGRLLEFYASETKQN